MSHADDETTRPGADAPEAIRTDYATVVASLVAADGDVDDAELAPLATLCGDLGLSDAARTAVMAAARAPDAAAVDAAVARLKAAGAYGVALVTDAVVITFADGAVAPGESKQVAHLAHALEIDAAQVGLIGRYVESVILDKAGAKLSKDLGHGVAEALHGESAIRRLYHAFRRN